MNNQFPISIFPPSVAEYVRQASESLDCDPAYIAVPLLPALASAIGNTRRIKLKKDWTEPPVVWTVIVGESGTVKSPALRLATKPILRRQRLLLNEYLEAYATYEGEVQRWQDTKKSERGDRPEPPPPCPHPLCSDITVEALADRLSSTPRGILVAVEELVAWLGSFNQYNSGGGDVAHWLAMHGASALKVDRKTGDRKTIFIPHASVCITGTIQPDTLRRMLLPEFFENGLVARLLPAMPLIRAKHWSEREIEDQVAGGLDAIFETLFELRQADGIDGDPEPVMVDLLPDAHEAWVCFVNEHNASMEGMGGAERAMMAKLEGYAARFALILHCVRQASGEKQSDFIDADDVANGITLARWFGCETRRIYSRLTESTEARQRRELLELIHRLGRRVTARQVKEHCRRFPTSDAAEVALNDLVDQGYGSWEVVKPDGPGRPSHVFCLADSPDHPVPQIPNSNGESEFAEPEHYQPPGG